MRPHQQVIQHQRRAQACRDQGGERLGPAQQKSGQEREARGESRGGHQHQAAPPGQVIDHRQDNFRQPFMRDPSRADERVRKRVMHRQRRMGEHPPARGDVEIGVGIVEQRHRLSERAYETGEPDNQRP